MKKLLKIFIPRPILAHYKRRKLYKNFFNDAIKYSRYSNTYERNDTKEKLRGDIIMRYHSIEKGLTMNERRLPFGKAMALILASECKKFSEDYGIDDLQVRQAVMILYEYLKDHKENNIQLEEDIEKLINELLKKFRIDLSTKQFQLDVNFYSNSKTSNFLKFSKSRISNRNYSEEDVPVALIDSAVSLANLAPSACNRQPSRVFMVKDRKKIDSVLSIQNGNRGFGHLANKLLVVTVDLSGFSGPQERNLPWVDGGIFSMNLLYALHYYGIAACPLNWAVTTDADEKLAKICQIPSSHRTVLLISCGFPKNKFNHPISLRYQLKDLITYS